jgi:hypothetical protein
VLKKIRQDNPALNNASDEDLARAILVQEGVATDH